MFRLALIFAFVPLTILAETPKSSHPSDPGVRRAMTILKANCLSCHGDEKHKSGLRLTSQANALKGGDNGPALVRQNPSESLLAKAILPDADPHMPPKKQLSDLDIASLKQWITEGANWDEKFLLAPTVEKPIQFVEMPTGYHPVLAIALSPDDKLLAIGRANHIFVHDLTQTNHPMVQELKGHRDSIQSLTWSPDGKYLASGGFRKIVLWDLNPLAKKREFTNDLVGRITSLQFTTNSETIVAADGVPTKSGLVHFISLSNGKSETIEAHKDSIYALRISPDGRLFATGAADKLAKLWDYSTRKEIAKYEAHMGYVLALTFNADSSRLATGSADKIVNIWDIKTRKQEITLNQHPAPVSALFWADDGKKLFSACEDGAVRLFTHFKAHSGSESSDGAQERTFTNVNDMLYCVTASADGKKVFAGCSDGTVYCWNNDGKLLEKFETPVLPAKKLADSR